MAIKTQYGNEVTPTEAITDHATGEFLACFAKRNIDGQKRFYRLHQLRAPGGISDILAALAGLPVRTDAELPDHETW